MKINYWHISSRRRFSRIARGRCATGQRWTLDNFSLMCLLLLCVSAKRRNWTLTSSGVGSMSNCKHASLSLLSTSHIEHSSNKPGVQRRRANKIMQTSLLEQTALFSIISQHFRCHFENIFLSLFSSSTLAIHLKLLLFDFRFFYLIFIFSLSSRISVVFCLTASTRVGHKQAHSNCAVTVAMAVSHEWNAKCARVQN